MMHQSFYRWAGWFCLFVLFSGTRLCAQQASLTAITKGFLNVPDSIQTSVYWYWLSGNISKEGVVKDLYAMKKAGINRAFIGNIDTGPMETPYNKVKLFTPEWWDILHTALKTAVELGIQIGIFNSPGWSQSGGPWVKPEQSMRYLAFADTTVNGGGKIHIKLKQPNKIFQDQYVVAYPFIIGDSVRLATPHYLAGDTIHVDKDSVLLLSSGKPTTIRSLTFYPANSGMYTNASLFYRNAEGTYALIKSFDIDRSNGQLNVGFEPFAPVAISFPEVSSDSFKIQFTRSSGGAAFSKIILSNLPAVERYKEKTLAKMFQSPHPFWNEYQWPQQHIVSDTSLVVDKKNLLDITKYMKPDGTLDWEAPAGLWVVSRVGMTPTGVTNSPAAPEGTGPEVDKMSQAHVASHFNAFLGQILSHIPPEDRKSWKVVVADSYETGGQNWTDSLRQKFIARYQYDPLKYLPVIEGKVVGSEDESDRFLWDLRRMIADKVAYDYVGGLRQISHQHGLTTWLENYGHWGFPGEFLQYGGQSDEVGGEFWSEGDLGNIENRAASSSAHIYGKKKVSAESFTAGLNTYGRYPALLKQRGDRFFTEGINNTLLHVYIEQPYDDKLPGVNTWFGTEFNRHNTWFSQINSFITYLKRCNFLLQQGLYVADVAYFIGEDAPKMTGVQDPPLPKGYSFDYINAEVILNRLSVKNGRFVLPDGMSYSVLVLPKLETMRPELLQKIQQLVAEGGTVLGPKPQRSPSLQDYPNADAKVKAIAAALWGMAPADGKFDHRYGKGRVMNGYSLEEAFNKLNLKPDMTGASDSLLFIHRHLPDADVYFVSNQLDKKVSVKPQFRVAGKEPELWNALDGTARKLPDFTVVNGSTEVPLELDAFGSAFIVFRQPPSTAIAAGKKMDNSGDTSFVTPLTGTWQIQYDTALRGPTQVVTSDSLFDWSHSADSSIRYYSGKAVYTMAVNWDRKIPAGETVWLDLGKVIATASVTINGQDAGGVWTMPYHVDISRFLKQGNNQIKITVINTWVNRLIGDKRLPAGKRKTWLSYDPFQPDSKPQSSGLLGPVRIVGVKY